MKSTPPRKYDTDSTIKKPRNSNLELYRIIVMLLIIAHHYVVNSGLFQVLQEEPLNFSSTMMLLFGAWGKTGINCFVLITGYFMCKSQFTWQKLLKLYLQIVFYTIIIYGVFCITGHERLTAYNIIWKLWPAKSIASDFTSCFILFYLFIPFLNIFVLSLSRKSHLMLVTLMLLVFSILPTVPLISVSFNYVTWFAVLYFVGSYIRLYGFGKSIKHSTWGWISLLLILIASCCIIGMTYIYKMGFIPKFYPYFFISDSNKILSLAIAVSSFMYFKDLRIPHSRLINAIGGATFGVLLIHANSDAMRTWLWRETVDCIGNYKDDVWMTLGYASGCVLIIFVVCAGIDWFRGRFIEPKLLVGTKRLFTPLARKIGESKIFRRIGI